jgi:hypothetical protein
MDDLSPRARKVDEDLSSNGIGIIQGVSEWHVWRFGAKTVKVKRAHQRSRDWCLSCFLPQAASLMAPGLLTQGLYGKQRCQATLMCNRC